MADSSSTTFRSLVLVAIFIVLTVGLFDFGFQRLSPIVDMREAADGIADLAASNPETLVLGSSHGRTFHVLGQQLEKKANHSTSLVAIPLENGKLLPYDWVLENRIAPLVDERTADGRIVRSKLKRFILLTEWWDSCDHKDRVHWNIPSRAWSFGHYLADLFDHGVNAYNRNYLQYQFRKLLPVSVLVRDRYDPRIKAAAGRFITGNPAQRAGAEYKARIAGWQRALEDGIHCIGAPGQMGAFGRILDFARTRGWETTVVLFPRMPGTMTDRAKETTLKVFREKVEALSRPHGVRVIDLTWRTPLRDEDFMDDFDHVTAQGNLKFAAWALENDLSFLLKKSPNMVGAGRQVEVLP